MTAPAETVTALQDGRACAECARLAAAVKTAGARLDYSGATDARVLLERHQNASHPRGATP